MQSVRKVRKDYSRVLSRVIGIQEVTLSGESVWSEYYHCSEAAIILLHQVDWLSFTQWILLIQTIGHTQVAEYHTYYSKYIKYSQQKHIHSTIYKYIKHSDQYITYLHQIVIMLSYWRTMTAKWQPLMLFTHISSQV